MSCETYGGGATNCTTPTTPVVTVPSTTPVAHHNDLPFTGGDVVAASLLGLSALATGIALWFSGRRNNRTV